jgi:hypothetical protein
MSDWVRGATPSIALGRTTPWKWTPVPIGSLLVTFTRTVSPPSTSITGPGTIPLYVQASTNRPGSTSPLDDLGGEVEHLGAILGDGGLSSGWLPTPSVSAGKRPIDSCMAASRAANATVPSSPGAPWPPASALTVSVASIPASRWPGMAQNNA